MPDNSRRRRAHLMVTLAGAVLALSGAAAVTVAVAGQQPAPPAPPDSATRAAPSVPQSEPDRTESSRVQRPPRRPELDWARPTRVVLPTLDVSASLVELDLDAQGVMTTPEEGARAGWFTPAPPPGVIGVSVIAGHVTWDDAPAVFFRLGELRPGDRVEVERRDGVTAVFEVRRIGEFPKDEFPTEAVYRHVNHADLRLITCGGEFDEASGHYLSNVIVWARMVSHHRT